MARLAAGRRLANHEHIARLLGAKRQDASTYLLYARHSVAIGAVSKSSHG